MRVLHLFWKGSEKDFKKDCRERKIRTRIVKSGAGWKHCIGHYSFVWLMAYSPNFDKYSQVLKDRGSLELYFYSEDDRNLFLNELAQRTKYKIVSSFGPTNYYKLNDLYGVEIIGK